MEEFIDPCKLVRKLTVERVPEFLPGKSPSHTIKYEMDLSFRGSIFTHSIACLTKSILKGWDLGVTLVHHVGQGGRSIKDNPQSQSLED